MPTPPPELSAEEVTSNDENDLSKAEKPSEKTKEKEILTKTAQPLVEQQTHGKSKDYDKIKESEERKPIFFNLFGKKEKKESLHTDQIYSNEFKELLQQTKTFVDNELSNYECGRPKQSLQSEKDKAIISTVKEHEERESKDYEKTKESEERKTSFFNLFSKKEKKDSLHSVEPYSKEFKELLEKTKNFVDNELNNYECEKSRGFESLKHEITQSSKETEERKVSFFNLFSKKEKREILHGDKPYTEEFKKLLQNTKSFVDNEQKNYEHDPVAKQLLQNKKEVITIPTEKIIKEELKESESIQSKKEVTPSTRETEERKISFFNLFGKKEKPDSSKGDVAYTEEFKELLQNTESFVNNELQNYECDPIEKQPLQSRKEVITIPTEKIIKEVDVKESKGSESTHIKKEEVPPSTKESEERKISFFNLFGKKEKPDSSKGDVAYTEEFKELLQNTESFVNNELQNYECDPIEKQPLQSRKEVITIPTEKIIKEVDVKESKGSESTHIKKEEVPPSTKESEERKISFFNLFGKKEKPDSSKGDVAYTEEFKELLQNTESFVNNELQNYECDPIEKQPLQSRKEVITIPTEKIIKEVDVKESKGSESTHIKKEEVPPSTKESEERKISFFNLFGKKEKPDSSKGDVAYTEEFKELLQNTESFVNNELQNYECDPIEKQPLQSRKEVITIPTEKIIKEVDVKESKGSESTHIKKEEVPPSTKESEERKISFFNLFGKKEKPDSSKGDVAYTEEFKELLQNTKSFVNNELQNYESEPTAKQHLQSTREVTTIPTEIIIKEKDMREPKVAESVPTKREVTPSTKETEEGKVSFFNLFSKKEKHDSLQANEAYTEEFKELLENTKSFVNNELQNYESDPLKTQQLQCRKDVTTIPSEKMVNKEDVKGDLTQLDTTKMTEEDKHAVTKRQADKDKSRSTEQRRSGFFGLFGKKDKKSSSKVEQQLEKETIVTQAPETETMKVKKEEIDVLEKEKKINELEKSPSSILSVQQTKVSVEVVQPQDTKMELQKVEKLENVQPIEKELFKEDDQSVEQKKGGFFDLFGKKDKKETPKSDRKDFHTDDLPSEKEYKHLMEKTSTFLNTELTNYEVPLPGLEKTKDNINIDLQDKCIDEIVESVEEEIYEEKEYPPVEKQKFETSLTEKLTDDNVEETDDSNLIKKETPIKKQTKLAEKQETDITQTDLESLLKETATFINTEIDFRSNEIPPKIEKLVSPVKEKPVETIESEITTTSEDDSKSQSSRESSPKKSGFLSLFTKKAKKDKAHKSKSKESEKGVVDSEAPDRLPVTDTMVQTMIDENKQKLNKEITQKKDIIVEDDSLQKYSNDIITDKKTLEAEQIAARQAIDDTHSFLTKEQLALRDTATSSISKSAVCKEPSSEPDNTLEALIPESIYLSQETTVDFNAVKKVDEDESLSYLETSVEPIHFAAENLKESVQKEIKEEIEPQEDALKSQLVQEYKDLEKTVEQRSKSPKKDSEDRKSGIFNFFGKKSKSKSDHEQTVDADSNLKAVLSETNDFITSECLHYDKPDILKETAEHKDVAPKSVTFSLDETDRQNETEATKVTNGECTIDTSITPKDSEVNEKEKGTDEKKSRFLGGLFGKKDKKHKKAKEPKEETPAEDLLNAELTRKDSTTVDHYDSEHIVEKDVLSKEVIILDSKEFDKEDDAFLKTLASTKSFLETENQNYDDSPNVHIPQKPTQTSEEHEEKSKHGGILKIITDKISKISPTKSSKPDTIKKTTDDLTLSKDLEIEETEKDVLSTKIDDVESLTTKFKQLKDKTEETKEEISDMVKTFENIRNESTFEKYANEADDNLKETLDDAQKEYSIKTKQIDSTVDKAEKLVEATATTITDNMSDQINTVHDYSNETFENLKKEFEKVKASATDEFLQEKGESIKDEYSKNINEVSSKLLDTAQNTVSSMKDNTIQQAKEMDESLKDAQTAYFNSAAELDSIINGHHSISQNIKQVSTNIKEKVEDEVKNASDFLHVQVEDSKKIPSGVAIEEQLHLVKDGVHTSATNIDDTIEKRKQDLKETLDSIKTTVDDKIEDISKAEILHKTDDNLKETLSDIGLNISHKVTDKTDALENVIQTSADKISTNISEEMQSVGDTLKQTKENINDKIKESQKSIVQEIEIPFHDTKQEVEKRLHKVQESGTNLIEQDKWKEVQDLKEQFEQKLEEIPQIGSTTAIADNVDIFEDELRQVKDKAKDIHDTTQDTLVHFQEEFIKDFKPTQFIEKEQPHKVLPQVYVSPKSSKRLSNITNKETELSAIKSEIEDSVSSIQKGLAELEVKSEDLTPIGKEGEATNASQSTQKRKPMFRLESEDEDVASAAEIKGFDFPKYTMETLHEKQLELKEKETKSIDEKLENIDKALQSLEEIEQMHTDKITEPKLHRVERKFERMASEILEKEAEEAKKGAVTNEELENKREKEFNRFVSQISTEEMSIFQNEYSSLCTEEIDTLLVDADVGSPGSQKDNIKDAVLGQLTRNETTDLTASRTEPTPSVLLLTKTNETQITTEKPTPQEEDSRVDSITYSEKKKFWESISSQESEADTSKSSKKQEVTFSEIVPPPVPKPRQSKQQRTDVESTTIKRTDSFDSQSEAAPNQGGYDNTGYISDSEDVEHYISDSEIEDRVPQIRERQMSVFYPTTGLGRKSIYERSLSLPTQDLYDIKNQLKLKKEHIEEQIKKGMVVEQLSTEFEEELPPEYKSFEMDNSKEEQKLSETRSAPEATTDDEIEQISEEVSKMATSKDVQKQSETEKLKDDTLYEQQEILYSKNVVMTTDEFLKSEKSLYDYSLTTTQIKDSKQMDSLFHKVEAFTEKSESSLIKETDLSAETHKSHQITSQQTHKIKDETIKFDTHKDRDIDLHVDKSEIEELEKESDNKRAEKPKAKERVAILKSPINLPEEKMESTIWETPVQVSKTIDEQAPEFSVENNKLSSLAQSSLDQEAFEELGPTRKLQVENILIQSLSDDSITLDEAKKMAASLMDDIEKEIQKCKPLTPSATESIPGGIFTCDKELKTSLLKLAEEKGLDKREMQLVESVLARKQRGLKSKDDATHASSVEITDEDLKYSGVEIDFSPSSSRSYILEQLEAEKQQKVFTETMPALDTLETKQQHLDHDLITEEKETKYVDEKEEKIVQDESTEVAKETEKKATSVEQIEDETIHKTITHKTSEDDKDQTVQTHSSGSKSSKEDSFQSPEGSRTDTEQGGKSGSFKKDQTSSSTSNLKSAGDRRSGTDFEGYSSSGESHYQSFEIDSSKSRPCSSDFEGLNVVASSEYESALTSQQTSGLSHGMSDYHTAISSLTSKESMKSLDSESSGNLASFEASEASETLVPSALENENDILEPVEVIDDFHEKIGEEIKAQHFDTPSKMKRSHEMTFQQEPVDDELIRRTSTDDLSTLRKFSGEESPSYLEKEMQSEMKSTTESYTSTASTVIEVPMDSVTLTSSTFTEGNTSYASTQIVSKAVDEDKAQQQQIETIEPKKRGHRRSESSLLGQTGQIPYMTNIEMKQKCDDFISGELLEYETDEKEYDKKYTQREEIINQQTKVAAPILEDEAEHPKEVEERSQKRRDSQDEQPLPGITVTQHMAPLKDKGFHYPDLELEEQQAAPDNSTPETPASASSKTSEESDQGKVYVLQQDSTKSTTVPPAAAQITKTEKPLIESRQETPITAHKVAKSGKDKEAEPTSESPDSDSFEMLEKPDLIDDFVVIEEVAKEASEQDQEGKSVRIEYSKKPTKKHDEEVENYLIQSSSKQAQFSTGKTQETKDDLAFDFESSPPMPELKSASEPDSKTKEYFHSYEQELEGNRKWIEQQFQGDQATMAAGYGYEMEFERAPLEDIKEEEVADFDSSRIGSLSSHKDGSAGSIKDSYSSTPEYDVLAGRKYFTRSGEHDDVSMSSLQEFENLERAMSLENKKPHQGSQDSSSTSGSSYGKRYSVGKNGQVDDISTNSLKEFEGLEKACIAVHKIEEKVKQEEALLTQIEEGHESVASESESCETLSGTGKKAHSSDSDNKMLEIDAIIKQAQCSMDKFIDFKDDEKPESIGRGDSLEEVSKIPDLDLDTPMQKATKVQWVETNDDPMVNSTDSLDLNLDKSPHHDSTDSLDQKTTARDPMTASTDSIEYQSKQKTDKDVMRSDSFDNKDERDGSYVMTLSDSLELGTTDVNQGVLSDSIDEEGSRIGIPEHSTSSSGKDFSSSVREEIVDKTKQQILEFLPEDTENLLEISTSTATHATYHNETDSIFSGSFTSGSNTMVSSTEAIDPNTETINLSAAIDKLWYDDPSNIEPYVSEKYQVLPEDDQYSHIIHKKIEMPTTVQKVTFTGPNAEEELRKYLETVGPSQEQVQETTEIDEFGNVHRKRIVTKQVVVGAETKIAEPLKSDEQYGQVIRRKIELPPTITKVSFTGEDADEQLRKYLETVEPKEETEETEVDEFGNIHTKKTIRKRIVLQQQDPQGDDSLQYNILKSGQRQTDIYSVDISNLAKGQELTSDVQKLLTSIAESSAGESSDHPQSAATVKESDTAVKGEESKQTKEGKKDKQVKDQHKLSEEMEELLEAMKEVGKK
ncbi:microtubule-associated protein futsch isoform X1 [Agrilus planipennis]|uniref:Microtubule-associated protein futsch isoform X1 n=1 Tax=Agrilus planipennis TaxID=224129 RepID=A0A7F5RGJ4_AGRPL|nr:microtubule-associated protein futsch isoform X1 [Agrilus planipennis]